MAAIPAQARHSTVEMRMPGLHFRNSQAPRLAIVAAAVAVAVAAQVADPDPRTRLRQPLSRGACMARRYRGRTLRSTAG
jgi:hypothetical protein